MKTRSGKFLKTSMDSMGIPVASTAPQDIDTEKPEEIVRAPHHHRIAVDGEAISNKNCLRFHPSTQVGKKGLEC